MRLTAGRLPPATSVPARRLCGLLGGGRALLAPVRSVRRAGRRGGPNRTLTLTPTLTLTLTLTLNLTLTLTLTPTLTQCKAGLAPGGLIVIKDNVIDGPGEHLADG